VVFIAIGWLANTKPGKILFQSIENVTLKRAPGYRMIREIVTRYTSAKRRPFTKVALIKLSAEGQYVTGFITDEHKNGFFTVFVPEGPIPTTGQIYHLTAQWVEALDVPVEDAMNTIFGCGAGSSTLIKKFMKREDS